MTLSPAAAMSHSGILPASAPHLAADDDADDDNDGDLRRNTEQPRVPIHSAGFFPRAGLAAEFLTFHIAAVGSKTLHSHLNPVFKIHYTMSKMHKHQA